MYICHWNFNSIPDNLQLTLDTLTNNNPFLIVTIGNFDEKTTNWYNNDTTSYEGLNTDAVTSQFGLQQLIYEPTYLTGNSSSCIDLIFSSQPNLAAESGVHSSLHSNCHHQIVFAKFNLNFFIHYLTNVKCGIAIRLILTLFVDQSMSSLGKTDFLRYKPKSVSI